MKNNIKVLSFFLASIILFASCSNSSSSSKIDDNSSKTTAAPQVTLPSSSDGDVSKNDDSSKEDSKTSDITPLMWEITSPEGTTIKMMGSMHALKDECYPLPERIMKAYNEADVLAVECDVTTASSNFIAQLKQMKNMNCEEGKTLKDYLDPDVYQGISDYLKASGASITLYDNYKPWVVSSTLDSMSYNLADLDTSKGIDLYLLELAHDDEKEIYEVESLNFQIDMIINFSNETYNLLLSHYNADYINTAEEQLTGMYDAWRTGDKDTILNILNEEESPTGKPLTSKQLKIMDNYQDTMIYNRNKTMAEAVKELLKGDKDVFYVVGLAHFVGEGGIIDLLEKDGYTVKQI